MGDNAEKYETPNLASGFLAEDLFSCNPSVIVDQINPILQDLETTRDAIQTIIQ